MNKEDYEILKKQLGREPEGAKEVLVRSKQGIPVVVRVSPIVNNRPFGSFYWLSCPDLKKQIDHLEANGVIHKIQSEILDVDEEFYQKVKIDHENYIRDRLKYIKVDQLEDQIPDNIWPSLKKRGVGGVQNFRSIRCLHMHYAQHLIYGNTIGKHLDENYNLIRS